MKLKCIICFLVTMLLVTACSSSPENKVESKDITESTEEPSKDDTQVSPCEIDVEGNIIYLKNDELSLKVDANTLESSNTDSKGNEIKLSEPVGDFDIGEIKSIDNGVSFDLIDEDIDVVISLINSRFNIKFRTEKERSFTWPKVESTKGFDSYIIPHNEGKYIPKNDKKFIEFLTKYESWDTLEFLSMPFIGLYNDLNTYTYIMKTSYNNEISFADKDNNLGFDISHQFTSNHKEKVFSYEIVISDSDYIESAHVFKDYLLRTDQFVTLKEKAEDNEEVEKLYGAIQIYLWSSGVLDKSDIDQWLNFVKNINSNKDTDSISKLLWNLFEDETKKLIVDYCNSGYVDEYGKKTIIRSINQILKRKDFYNESYFNDLTKSDDLYKLIDKGISNLNDTEIYDMNLHLFYESYKEYFGVDIKDVGNAFSTKMLDELHSLGIDKAWLGGDNMAQNWQLNKFVAKKAIEEGYLIGSYDSYHSMHKPGEEQWATAAFDDKLWETGGIMRKDGNYVGGYKQVGRKVSPLVSLPYVKDRMSKIMDSIEVNSWFIDCDAAGELYEDYNPLHPASKEDDKNARKERLQWMIDEYDLVVGSEGGTWYSSDTIHFAQGMMIPVIGWGDEDMRQNRDSEYFLGKYWPKEGPETFVKQVPLKDEYEYIYFNPEYRLPLYQTVYHDSIITTSHWGSSSLKFSNEVITNALTELLYNVPPLYNLNLEELDKHGQFISRMYEAFSKMHEITATVPLKDFEILSDDRLVQKTIFGNEVEVIANYKDMDVEIEGRNIPANSVEIFMIKDNIREIFTPSK